MNGDISGNASKTGPETDWQQVRNLTDEQVHEAVASDPDIHPTDESFWVDARVVMPKRKEVTMRLDADLLA
jgi:hypothetical protein